MKPCAGPTSAVRAVRVRDCHGLRKRSPLQRVCVRERRTHAEARGEIHAQAIHEQGLSLIRPSDAAQPSLPAIRRRPHAIGALHRPACRHDGPRAVAQPGPPAGVRAGPPWPRFQGLPQPRGQDAHQHGSLHSVGAVRPTRAQALWLDRLGLDLPDRLRMSSPLSAAVPVACRLFAQLLEISHSDLANCGSWVSGRARPS
jgi:hypothetical protein